MAVTVPPGLKGLMLDGALCDAQVYIKTQWRDVLSTLPTLTQKLLKKLEDEKDYDNPMYKEMEDTLGKHFTCRLSPHPECLKQSFSKMNQEIYVKVQGASEFTLGGALEFWSITARLHIVKVPTIVLKGEFDTMSEECSQLIVDNITTAVPLVHIPRAAHCKLIDEPYVVVNILSDFLKTCESNEI
eukprot:CAMPEP_0119043228 /NCGR_PEP_ID=MMETSP1177-20130426/19660_1 /TAXON_ID=2985 /ORGANISM="Ochromonas sp, Strain CCMP1899" /LENGTH=185 /DNA_ID=CAMNT_0007010911 /DNA_START=505 /DNA_END=1062 /DNA_ORIENTATION=-